jgi:5-oxopent-3-ene-1,2,5-tricarboxylate decarboxylase/2-hydroxyhepta-2,4-diene-1,7-dioate isomerase
MAEWRRIVLDGAPVVAEMTPTGLMTLDGRAVDAATVTHLPPCEPTKILASHFNYRSRHVEMGREVEPSPTFFSKLPSSLVGHRGAVIRPPGCEYLNYEGEIAAVVGKVTRNVTIEEAADHIAGYTIANDFGLHDFRDTDWGAMVRVKSSDTMCPLGPGLVVGWDWRGKGIRTLVNGVVRQEGSTDDMMWSPDYMVADLARTITLHPGDVVLTGTPANSRPVDVGDVVVVEVDGLGALENRIVAGPVPLPDFGAHPTRTANVIRIALGGDYAGEAG